MSASIVELAKTQVSRSLSIVFNVLVISGALLYAARALSRPIESSLLLLLAAGLFILAVRVLISTFKLLNTLPKDSRQGQLFVAVLLAIASVSVAVFFSVIAFSLLPL